MVKRPLNNLEKHQMNLALAEFKQYADLRVARIKFGLAVVGLVLSAVSIYLMVS